MFEQITFADLFKPMVEVTKPIRILELFAGYGSQSMALRNLGAKFEHYKCVEFDEFAQASFNAVHGTSFSATDVCNVHGTDLEIVDRNKYTYLLTYLLVPLHRYIGSRTAKRNGRGQRHKIGFVVGSPENT